MAEAAAEIELAPEDLGAQVVRVEKRRDGVAPHLRHGPARGEASSLLAVALAHAAHDLAIVALQPARQGRADVEGQAGVVVDDGGDVVLGPVDARVGVSPVALGVDARVPVGEGRGRGFARHLVGPRVLARRLVKMPVHDQGKGGTLFHWQAGM